MHDFKEGAVIRVDYPTIHRLSRRLHRRMSSLEPGPWLLIAIGRGGWVPARILAAISEESGEESVSLTVMAQYRDVGSPNEHVLIAQGLDELGFSTLRDWIANSRPVWLVDGPYSMGGAVEAVLQHLCAGLQPNIDRSEMRVAALHWITFDKSLGFPWRTPSGRPPDAYAARLHYEIKPYVEYPWERAHE